MTQFRMQMRLLFAAQFFAIGAYLPFMPVWLADRGLSPTQIGLVLTLPQFARILLGPALAFMVDRFGHRQRALAFSAAAAGLATAALLGSASFMQIIVVFAALAAFWSVLMPFSDALALDGVKAHGIDYGRVRLWGSASFIAANLGAGILVGEFSANAALIIVAVSFLAVGGLAMLIADPPVTAGDPAGDGGALAPGVRRLLRADFIAAVAIAGLLQSSHAVLYAFGTLHWQTQGLSTPLIGLLWAVGVVAEIILFAVAPAVMARLDTHRMLLLAALAACVRWGLMTLNPPLWCLFGLQFLHAFTFGATHLAIIGFVSRTTPQHYGGTAQSLLYGVSSLIMAVTTLLAGPLYGAVAGQAYWAMSAMGAGALAVLLLVKIGYAPALARTV